MVPNLDELAIKHVLLALSAAQEAQRTLDAAVAVAQSLGAQLSGLFVEDVNLLRLAALPFARETDLATASSRPLESTQIKRALRQQAAQLERMLGEAARRLQINWSFSVVQGQLLASALAHEADLMVLPGALAPTRLSSQLRRATASAGPVLALWDATPAATRALAVAAALAGRQQAELLVLVPAEDMEQFAAKRAQAQQWLAQRGSSARFLRWEPVGVDGLLSVAQQQRAGCLVVPQQSEALQMDALARLLMQIDCPLILSK